MLGYNTLGRFAATSKAAIEAKLMNKSNSSVSADVLPPNFHAMYPNFEDIKSRRGLTEMEFTRKRAFIMNWMQSKGQIGEISSKEIYDLLAGLGINKTSTTTSNWNDWLQAAEDCITQRNSEDGTQPASKSIWPDALELLTSKLANLLPAEDFDEVSTAEAPYSSSNPASLPDHKNHVPVHHTLDEPRNSRLTSNETVVTTSTSGTSKYDMLASILHSNEVKHSFYGSPEREESPVATPSLTEVHSPDRTDEVLPATQSTLNRAENDDFLEESEHSTLEILEWSNGLNGFRKATPLTEGSPIRDFRFLHPYNKQLFPPPSANVNAESVGPSVGDASVSTNQSLSRGSSPARAQPVLWRPLRSSPERLELHAHSVPQALPTILEQDAAAPAARHATLECAVQTEIDIVGNDSQDKEKGETEELIIEQEIRREESPPGEHHLEHKEMETQTCDFGLELAVSGTEASELPAADLSMVASVLVAHSAGSLDVLTTVCPSSTSDVPNEELTIEPCTVPRPEDCSPLRPPVCKQRTDQTTEAAVLLLFPDTVFTAPPAQVPPVRVAEAETDAVSVNSGLTNVSRDEVRRMAHLLAGKKLRRPAAGLARRKHAAVGTTKDRKKGPAAGQFANTSKTDGPDENSTEGGPISGPVSEIPVLSTRPAVSADGSHTPPRSIITSGSATAIKRSSNAESFHRADTISSPASNSPHTSRNGSPLRGAATTAVPSPAKMPSPFDPVPGEPSITWVSFRMALLLMLYIALLVAGRQYYQQNYPSPVARRNTHNASKPPYSAGVSRNAETVADPSPSFLHHHAPAEPAWHGTHDSSDVASAEEFYDHLESDADLGTLSLKVSIQPTTGQDRPSRSQRPAPGGQSNRRTRGAASDAANPQQFRSSGGTQQPHAGPGECETGTVSKAMFTPLRAVRQAWAKLKLLLNTAVRKVTRPLSSVLSIFSRRS